MNKSNIVFNIFKNSVNVFTSSLFLSSDAFYSDSDIYSSKEYVIFYIDLFSDISTKKKSFLPPGLSLPNFFVISFMQFKTNKLEKFKTRTTKVSKEFLVSLRVFSPNLSIGELLNHKKV